MLTLSEILLRLQGFYARRGCAILQPFDIPSGAGTFAPATLLGSLDTAPLSIAYVAPSRRPTDGRYGQNPNRLGKFYQFQAVLKPAPSNAQDLYLDSLKELGIDTYAHDVRFVEDNWESPTLGAFGLGWEVWLDGMEVSQFTYFQQVGGLGCRTIPLELTYGVERLAMSIQGVSSVFDIIYAHRSDGSDITYRDVHMQQEIEFSAYNFKVADNERTFRAYKDAQDEARSALKARLPLVAYEYIVLSSHYFNILDARHAISITNRQSYILEIRELVKQTAKLYVEDEEQRSKNIACMETL